MIDTHCHILWGVDDASETMSQSMDMIHLAIADGIQAIVATSHVKEGMFENDEVSLKEALSKLQEEIKKENLDIKIYFGGENYVSHHTMHKLEEGNFVTYHHGKYMLVEFAWTKNVYDHPTSYLKEIMKKGYVPVIAHPERYEIVHEEYQLLKTWRDMGCLLQVNRTSILGLDKIAKANQIANQMLEDDLVDLIASDAHRPYAPRLPKLSDSYRYVKERYGENRCKRCFIDNPKKVLGI